jgi:hypothetical protein
MTERLASSFRDPAGFLFRRDGVLYRQVNEKYRENYDQLVSSGLYDELVRRQLLVPHIEAPIQPAEPDLGSLVIQPEVLPFISYPFEWCPGQLRAAGEATLEIQLVAIDHGMSLRDASAYNIQFHNGRPTLIDTLSFEPLADGAPWSAYGQYCRHFLAPLALMNHVDVKLGSLLRTELDGIPLDLASRLLPTRTRFQWGLGVHLHAHAASQRRHAEHVDATPDTHKAARKPMSRRALIGLVESLSAATRKQRWRPAKSTWRDYYALRESYSLASMQHKTELVSDALKSVHADVVWDLGANTGHFSQLASDITGAHVVAIEMDRSAVEIHWEELRASKEPGRVLPLVNDLTNPTPAQGWAHRERASLADRGQADVVMALALVHHLAIGNNVPLSQLMEWLSTLAQTVIIEWIPKEDPMVQRLLASREDIFDDYTTATFELAASQFFDVRRSDEIKDSVRTLFVLERQ